ncbi:sugar transferase [Aquiflexum sp. TKW24L]|uniref:sugar transferase n=1 Tax=Aquiflexum sp. TKW24L TaxID=2942212 RepID=UPI0020BEF2AC|nr:sugar transferase [Aquiflexum sp. TKW24L]MCL6259687.1 sugar transferase [Aquiflexum sp. TKW24L]
MGLNAFLESEILQQKEFPSEWNQHVGIPQNAYFFIQKYVRSPDKKILFLRNQNEIKSSIPSSHSCLVSERRLNDYQDSNQFLSLANRSLSYGGLLIGSVETYTNRKKKIKENRPATLGNIVYSWDAFLHRFIPKTPIAGKLYEFVSKDKGKLMSDVEALGRLCATGFELIEQQEIGERMFFVAKKVGNPYKEINPTYWPIVKLRRVGKGGIEFTVYKLRTMYPYSEYLQDLVYQKNNLSDGGKFKDDFRVSTLGKFLRKFWLDEIPMLWNLIKGEIKIVGVRPLSRQYFNLYSTELKERRVQFKPGLIPPYYADMPHTLEEIMASEMRYLEAYSLSPIKTDINYFFKIMKNIVFKGARSG